MSFFAKYPIRMTEYPHRVEKERIEGKIVKKGVQEDRDGRKGLSVYGIARSV